MVDSYLINPLFGFVIGRFSRVKHKASRRDMRSALIRYIITIVLDLDMPISQCTNTFWCPSDTPTSINSKTLSK
jgi:hypothetical protein